jgi:hypothetical protein
MRHANFGIFTALPNIEHYIVLSTIELRLHGEYFMDHSGILAVDVSTHVWAVIEGFH